MGKLLGKIHEKLMKKTNIVEVNEVNAPADGEVILLEDVNDPVFSDGGMGLGCAIIPENGKLYAPISGVVEAVIPTKHAIGITSNDGKEVLLHIGVNTVELNGRGFSPLVKKGEHIEAGSLIMKYDLDLIKEYGFDTDVIVILTNSNQYEGILYEPKSIRHGEVLFTINDNS